MQINKDIITKEAEKFITHIFLLPETESVRVKDIVVRKEESISEKLKKMVEKSYHDCYSDLDLHVTVRINPSDQTGLDLMMRPVWDLILSAKTECIAWS